MKSPVLLTFWLCCILAAAATATTYVVLPDGTGDFPTIQAAIDGAVNGDVIELVDGTYVGPLNRRVEYGGKSITIRSQSGNPEACIIDCEGSEAQPEWGIRFDMGEGPQSVLEGVTVTNGWISDSSAGAGIQFRSSSNPTIRNCRFTNHRAGGGAGAWAQNSSPTLIDCVFMDNTVVGEGAGRSAPTHPPASPIAASTATMPRAEGGRSPATSRRRRRSAAARSGTTPHSPVP